MKQKEVACFREPPRKQAGETGANFRQATIPKPDNTTNTTNRQFGIISQLLLCGAENATGYFWPGNQAERDRCVRSMRRRTAEILETAQAIEEAVI